MADLAETVGWVPGPAVERVALVAMAVLPLICKNPGSAKRSNTTWQWSEVGLRSWAL